MIGIQEIVTYLILVACVLWAGRHFYLFFKHPKDGDDPCAHCASGCDLRRMMKEKQQECKGKSKKKKKSCCG